MSATPKQLEKLKVIGGKINEATRIVIVSHVSPDADTVGTALGLSDILREQGKDVTVLVPTPAMSNLRGIPGWDEVVFDENEARRRVGKAEMIIAVDNTGLTRFGNWKWVMEYAKDHGVTTVNLDHHDTNSEYADFNYVEPDAPAAAVVITRLAQVMEWNISPRAATDLFAGLSSDTGNFRGKAAQWEAFLTGAHLLKAGADKGTVARITGGRGMTLQEVRLVGMAYDNVVVNSDGVAYVGISQEMLARAGIAPEDSKIVLWKLNELMGWKAMVVMTERRRGQFAVSVRTRHGYSAIDIAGAFGGGGHYNAAGVAMYGGTLERNLAKVVARATEVVRGKAAPGPDVGLAA
jgi:bifunctional oligoribonuclease and PAP phosphatase NrnA